MVYTVGHSFDSDEKIETHEGARAVRQANPGVRMIAPRIHLNGTSADALTTELEQAVSALRKALDAMQEAAPNGRDYYTISADAYAQAAREHNERIKRVESVIVELETIWDAIVNPE